MYITPINSQSFTGFRLKSDGAKVLAELFIDNPEYEKAFVHYIINPLKKCRADVSYNGRDVFVKNEFGKRQVLDFAEINEFGSEKNSVYKVMIKNSITKNKRKEDYYIPDRGKGARRLLANSEKTGIPSEFFAAKEIAEFEDKILFPELNSPIIKREELLKRKTKELKVKYTKKPL